MQIAIMVFLIRKVLAGNAGKVVSAGPRLDLRFLWPLGLIDPKSK